MNPLFCYIRARLQRRLFVWFAATIVLTVVAVLAVMHLTSDQGPSGRSVPERIHAFVGGRFERVWDSPADREELARAMSRDLDLTVILSDAGGAVLAEAGPPCEHGRLPATRVLRDGVPIGSVRVCAERLRGQPWRVALPLVVIALVLWMASAMVARRLARPMVELARVAHELGAGNFAARARVPHHHHFGEAAAMAVTMNDMAARIERQLTEQRELLAAVSHELRTPLARVRLLTEMARGGGATDKTLDDLDREVVEMDALVGDLLASSRMDFAALEKRPLDAIEAASRALERASADPAALVVERETDAEILVEADATLLGRALGNLVDNAKKHGGGVEALKIRREGGRVSFEVEDKGAGFAPGEEARVFEPFYRRGENGSLGLGLSLVKRIAEAHGGRAYAENRAEGGARVGMELPAKA